MWAKQFSEFYRNKRVLITGHTGFKGAWLATVLQEYGGEVLGLALPPDTPDSLFEVAGLSQSLQHVEGDITEPDVVAKVFRDFQPEVVFHMAAQSLVRRSYDQPVETFQTNVMGSIHILEAIRTCQTVRSVIFVTSDKCYKNKEWDYGYREVDELGGKDPYSASKAAAEIVFASWCHSFFNQRPSLGISTVRAGNVLGGGDQAVDRIVPDCIRSLIRNEDITIRNPVATRPWQHVLEPIRGYMLLAARQYEEPQTFSGPWNFGPTVTSNRPVADLVDRIISNWGSGRAVHPEAKGPQNHEAGLLHINCDKAALRLNWLPRWDFADTIRETVHWYKEVHNGGSPLDVTKAQIAKYMESPS